MSVKDFTPFPYGADPDSQDVRDWYDKLRNRLCIDYQNVITPATGDETYLFDVSASVTGKVTLASLLAVQQNWLVDISGASGGQIKFPATQNPSSNVNTLDDYEEGTWTPTDASGAGLAFSAPTGSYTKIGNRLLVGFNLAFPATANGATAQIGGLPFPAIGNWDTFGVNLSYSNATTNIGLYFATSTSMYLIDATKNAQVNSTLSGFFVAGNLSIKTA